MCVQRMERIHLQDARFGCGPDTSLTNKHTLPFKTVGVTPPSLNNAVNQDHIEGFFDKVKIHKYIYINHNNSTLKVKLL
jgi:hypothetical protein